MRTIILITAILSLCGCASALVDQRGPYVSVKEQEVTMPGGTYIVKIANGKAIVHPTLEAAFNTIKPYEDCADAVRAALKKTGRNCHLTEGYQNGVFFEFNFVCK